MISKKYYKLIAKELSDSLTTDEKTQLEEWLRLEENKIEYDKLRLLWQKTEVNTSVDIPEIENSFKRLSQKLDTERTPVRESSFIQTIENLFTPYWKPALAGLSTVLIIMFVLFNNGTPENIITVSTNNAEHKEIVFPDGSTAMLNNTSELTYAESFGDSERKVALKGEAFFSVVKSSTPFIVETGLSKVQVLGTKFNINERENKTTVIVKEGLVKFENINNNLNESVLIPAGSLSEVWINMNPIEPRKIDVDYRLGWLNNKIIFEQTSLTQIADELNRCFNVRIIINDESLKHLTLTGSFNNDKLETILHKICLTLNLDYTFNDNSYTLIKKDDSF